MENHTPLLGARQSAASSGVVAFVASCWVVPRGILAARVCREFFFPAANKPRNLCAAIKAI
jgi:hypothetical protein